MLNELMQNAWFVLKVENQNYYKKFLNFLVTGV